MNGFSALQWVGGAAAAQPWGVTNQQLPPPAAEWNSSLEEDEVDAYDHLTVYPVESTDEFMAMDVDGPEYYAGWTTDAAALLPSPPSAKPPSARRRRRRHSDTCVEFDALARPQPGGLGRVLDQKRRGRQGQQRQSAPRSTARLGRRGGSGGEDDSALRRRRRLEATVPKESHVNKSPPPCCRRKPHGRRQRAALYLGWVEWREADDGRLVGVTFWPSAAVGMANMEQQVVVTEDGGMIWVAEEPQELQPCPELQMPLVLPEQQAYPEPQMPLAHPELQAYMEPQMNPDPQVHPGTPQLQVHLELQTPPGPPQSPVHPAPQMHPEAGSADAARGRKGSLSAGGSGELVISDLQLAQYNMPLSSEAMADLEKEYDKDDWDPDEPQGPQTPSSPAAGPT